MNPSEREQLVARLRAQFGKNDHPTEKKGPPFDRDGGNALDINSIDRPTSLAGIIDHTALKPETTEADVRALCDEVRKYGFATACVNPSYVSLAAEYLRDAPAKTCTVIGFPLGATLTAAKAKEAELALKDGAEEIDMVIHVGMLKSSRYDYVEQDVRAVVEATRSEEDVIVKVIIETALLTDEEKVIACILAENAGADFVKTSTGFASGGATPEDVALMHHAVEGRLGVKASGGIRNAEAARTMVKHGATRIGASSSVAILEGLDAEEGAY